MGKLQRTIAAVVAGISTVVLAAGFIACNGGGKDPDDKKPTVQKTRVSDCTLEYNWGEVFNGENLAYEITYPDSTKDYAVDGFTFSRKNGSDITAPLNGSDTEIEVLWKGVKDEVEYSFTDTLTLTMKDPHNAETMVFSTPNDVSNNDKVYMFGDGTFYACGIQAVEYWQYIAAQGHWSWDGSELCVVVEKDRGSDLSDGGRTITVTKGADGSYTFTIYWGAFPMNMKITAQAAGVYLTPEERFGDTSLTKGKNYKVWNDADDIVAEG